MSIERIALMLVSPPVVWWILGTALILAWIRTGRDPLQMAHSLLVHARAGLRWTWLLLGDTATAAGNAVIDAWTRRASYAAMLAWSRGTIDEKVAATIRFDTESRDRAVAWIGTHNLDEMITSGKIGSIPEHEQGSRP